MILAFDTWYFDHRAKTVCLAFAEWAAAVPYKVYAEVSENVEEYVPGAFYRRELPCILGLWQRVEENDVEAVVIDGFVYLDDEGTPGLGGHLYAQLGGKVPVMGVAKSDFSTVQKNKRALLRGGSKRPLYITAIGMDLDRAADNIARMAGAFRMPTLLQQLDRLTKQV
jgi:deoxyribonuclease V